MSKHRAVVIPAEIGRGTWSKGKKSITFTPARGKPVAVYDSFYTRTNPRDIISGDTWSARIVVGFNVDDVPTWSVEDVIPIVKEMRMLQIGKPDSTFLYQRGIYTQQETGNPTTEDGVQIIIIKFDEREDKLSRFETNMYALASHLAKKLDQESVILQYQKNGIVTKSYWVYGRKKK